MLLSLYIAFAIMAFSLVFLSFIVDQSKLAQQITLLGFALILFAALAPASAHVEKITCENGVLSENKTVTTTHQNATYTTAITCQTNQFYYQENMFIFGFMAMVAGVLFLIKSFDGFYFSKGRL